ncbi:MAG: acyl-CoA thioester hydrolase/BAAT C-terminal domain-containing protein [Pseudomonadota bacterium]
MTYKFIQSYLASKQVKGLILQVAFCVAPLALVAVSLGAEALAKQSEASSPAVEKEIMVGPELPYAFFQKPSTAGPHPAIIVLGGAEGGDQTARRKAKLFTEQGFAVLGLPYYLSDTSPLRVAFPKLPGTFDAIPVDQVETAKAWLQQRTDIRHDDIGIYGVSKGAEMALLSGSLIDGFAAIAAIVPSDVVWEGWGTGTTPGTVSSFSWRGQPLPFVPYKGMQEEFAAAAEQGRLIRFRDFHDRGRHASPAAVTKARIAIDRIDEPVLVAGGDADIVWNSGEMAQIIAERRADAGLPTVSLVFLNAGHLLSGTGEDATFASEEDLAAQKTIWPATVQFFRDHLMN